VTGRRALDWLFRDRRGRLVLWQRPNLPLSIWAIAWVTAWPLHGTLHHVVHLIGGAALFIWAALELFDGASPFRRLLGVTVLVLMVAWH
jgi:hypothetical protein